VVIFRLCSILRPKLLSESNVFGKEQPSLYKPISVVLTNATIESFGSNANVVVPDAATLAAVWSSEDIFPIDVPELEQLSADDSLPQEPLSTYPSSGELHTTWTSNVKRAEIELSRSERFGSILNDRQVVKAELAALTDSDNSRYHTSSNRPKSSSSLKKESSKPGEN
jgi:hypothetical protein